MWQSILPLNTSSNSLKNISHIFFPPLNSFIVCRFWIWGVLVQWWCPNCQFTLKSKHQRISRTCTSSCSLLDPEGESGPGGYTHVSFFLSFYNLGNNLDIFYNLQVKQNYNWTLSCHVFVSSWRLLRTSSKWLFTTIFGRQITGSKHSWWWVSSLPNVCTGLSY